MPANRLTGREKTTLVLWILAAVLGVWFAHRYFFRAFPEASVHFKVTRNDAVKEAKSFLGGLGENVDGYRSAVEFRVEDQAKVYLERELGLERTNQMLSGEINIWYWHVRFFRPQQEEEFQVKVSPNGEIVGFEHVVPEAQAGGSPDRQAAEETARILLSRRLGIDLSKWDFLTEEANSTQKPQRLDWSFTWEKHGFRAKDAPYRLRVTLDGEKPGEVRQFLKVPEAWSRDYEKLRSGNNTLATIFLVPYIALLAIAVWYAIGLTRTRQTRWGAAIKIGIVAAALLLLQNLNDWPLWGSSYDTKDPYASFLIGRIALALLLAVLSALTISLVLPAAEPLYRESQPDKLQLKYLLTRRGMRTREFFKAVLIGFCMAAAHIGFIVAFYMIAAKLGAWAPEDLNYSDAVNTYFPWISGIAVGVLASTNEEFTFRLFAIPFFRRLTGSRVIAVLVPAFLWSFLHSNYPQEPAYIRGIEVGLIGIVAGVVMLRWGILATLTWHYTVDASLVGLLLVRSDVLYFKISGVIVGAAALLPLAFAGVSYLARGGFEEDADLKNSAEPKPDLGLQAALAPEEVSVTTRRYEPLSLAALGTLAVAMAAGGLIAVKLKMPHLGDYLRVQVDARKAQERADAVLKARGIDAKSYRHATNFLDVTNPFANEFLRRRIGIEGLNAIYANRVPGALWSVRYFRSLDPEEYSVVLKPDGSLHSVHHTLAEAAEGASLSKEEATNIAEKYLREEKKIDLDDWALVEATSNKKPHRIDHKLTWQEKKPLDAAATGDHAYVRMELNVFGKEVANYRTFLKIPEEWTRQQERWGMGRVLALIATILFYLGTGVLVLVVFFKNFRSEDARAVPWRGLSRLALLGLAGYLLTFLLSDRIAQVLGQYPTATPLKLTVGTLVVGGLIGAAFNFGALVFLLGLAWFFCRRAFGEDRLPTLRNMPAAYYRDAVWIALGGAGGWIGLNRLAEFASAHWPTLHRTFTPAFGGAFAATSPVGAIAGTALARGFSFLGIVGLGLGLLCGVVRPLWLKVLAGLGLAFCLVGLNWGEPADFVKSFCLAAVLLAALAFAAVRIVRFNVMGWFLALATVSCVGNAVELLAQPNAFYRSQGYGVILLLAVLLAIPFFLARGRTTVAR